jgi:hypothetical protein
MTKAMRSFPQGISREERGKLFCIEAKLCSGKFNNRQAAEQECANRPPSLPRGGGGKRRGRFDADAIARCLAPKLTGTITVSQLSGYLMECAGSHGGGGKKPSSRGRYINKCAAAVIAQRDPTKKLTFAESVKINRACEAEWKSQQGAG